MKKKNLNWSWGRESNDKGNFLKYLLIRLVNKAGFTGFSLICVTAFTLSKLFLSSFTSFTATPYGRGVEGTGKATDAIFSDNMPSASTATTCKWVSTKRKSVLVYWLTMYKRYFPFGEKFKEKSSLVVKNAVHRLTDAAIHGYFNASLFMAYGRGRVGRNCKRQPYFLRNLIHTSGHPFIRANPSRQPHRRLLMSVKESAPCQHQYDTHHRFTHNQETNI